MVIYHNLFNGKFYLISCLDAKESERKFLAKLSIFSIIIKTFFSFLVLFFIAFISSYLKDSLSQNFILLILIISLFFIEFVSCIDFKKDIKQKNSLETNYSWPLIVLVSFFVLIIFSAFFIDVQQYSLHLLRYIEKPQDSAWYLIHNGNTTSDTINGLTKDNIEILKEGFQPQNQCNGTPNALYGYMAWNLGNTKVFCPNSVDFFDGTDNTEKSIKCFVIDGKYLQNISEYYISSL